MTEERTRENRLRRMAAMQGFALQHTSESRSQRMQP
jgi:hypothetical protein